MSRLLTRCPEDAGWAEAKLAATVAAAKRQARKARRAHRGIDDSRARAPEWRRHGRIPHAGLVDSRDACPRSGRPGTRRGRGVSARRSPAVHRNDCLHLPLRPARRRHGRRDDRPGRRCPGRPRPGHAAGHPDGLRRAALRRVRDRRDRDRRQRHAHAGRPRGGPALAAARRHRTRGVSRQPAATGARGAGRVGSVAGARGLPGGARLLGVRVRGRLRNAADHAARRRAAGLAGVQHAGPGRAPADQPDQRHGRRLLRAGRRPDRDGTAGHGAPPHRHAGARSTWPPTPKGRSISTA